MYQKDWEYEASVFFFLNVKFNMKKTTEKKNNRKGQEIFLDFIVL